MLNKIEALYYFCNLADTLSFRETAVRLAVSPPVVTRVIADLEVVLGESLFKRNSRNVTLTAFGESLLPQARQLISDSEKIFSRTKRSEELSGTVRITALDLLEEEKIVTALLNALKDYPYIRIEWLRDSLKLDSIRERIDIGIRCGIMPDSNFIVRTIRPDRSLLVATPAFIQKYGYPRDWTDLLENYPFAGIINPQTGKLWPLEISGETRLSPHNIIFTANSPFSELHAVLSGQAFGQISELYARAYLEEGRLIELLPETDYPVWQFYLYRPYHATTSSAVLKVFDLLYRILCDVYSQRPQQD